MNKSRLYFLFLALSASLWVGCQKDNSDDISMEQPVPPSPEELPNPKPGSSDEGIDPEVGNTTLFDYHEEQSENYQVSYKYNDDVIILTPARQSSFLTKVEDDSVLYFAANTPQEILPTVGSILSSAVTEQLPHGLGGKVLSNTQVDGQYRVVTTLASLEEIFESLTWNANIEMTDSLLQCIDDKGNEMDIAYGWYDSETDSCYLDRSDRSTRASIGRRKIVKIKLGKSTTYGAKLDGAINLGAIIHTEGNIKSGNFVFYLEPVINLDVTYTAGLLYNKNLFQDMEPFDLFHLRNIVKGVLPIGPLVLTPYVDVECYADFGATGTVSLKMGKTISFQTGFWQNNPDDHFRNTTPKEHNDVIRQVSLDGNIEVSLTNKFDLGCGLYTRNIAVSLNPYLKHSIGADFCLSQYTDDGGGATTSSDMYYKINAGAEGELLFEINDELKWGPKFKLLESNIFEHSWPLLPRLTDNNFGISRKEGVTSSAYDVNYTLEGGLLSRFMNIYPGLVVYEGKNEVNSQHAKQRYVETNGTKTFDFVLNNLRLNKNYLIEPSVYINDTYLPLGFKEYMDAVNPVTGEAADITQSTVTLYCTITNLPDWAETGVEVKQVKGLEQARQRVHGGALTRLGPSNTRAFQITGLEPDTEYRYAAYVRDGEDYIYGEEKTFTTAPKEDELRAILTRFYLSTNGDNWFRNDNWCTDAPIEDWYGVAATSNFQEKGRTMSLYLSANNLTGDADLSGCQYLRHVLLQNNELTSLDISSCQNLEGIVCDKNQLSSLNANDCPALKSISCYQNRLTSLNIKGSAAIEYLWFFENQLTHVDISHCLGLKEFVCYRNNLSGKLDFSVFSKLERLECSINQLNSVNVNGCKYLKTLTCYDNQLTSLTFNGCKEIEYLNCNNNLLTVLDISGYKSFVELHCDGNQLSGNIDVSNCTKLEYLSCSENRFTSLDASGCGALKTLYADNNQLTSLNINGCSSLEMLYCWKNRLNQVIPVELDKVYFMHDVKYIYHQSKGQPPVWETNEYGWWYPGEPESGRHERIQ